jgi:hypothetical protein
VEECTTSPEGRIALRFDTLLFEEKRRTLRAGVIRFVNSKGLAGVDDAGRPVRVESGVLVSDEPEITLDEGSELRLLAIPES